MDCRNKSGNDKQEGDRERNSSANAQVGRCAGALVGDEAQAVAVLLHQLAVAREYLVTRLHCAAEIAAAPAPCAGDIATEGTPTDGARRADGQTNAQTGQIFATHKTDEGRAVSHTDIILGQCGRGEGGEQGEHEQTHIWYSIHDSVWISLRGYGERGTLPFYAVTLSPDSAFFTRRSLRATTKQHNRFLPSLEGGGWGGC